MSMVRAAEALRLEAVVLRLGVSQGDGHENLGLRSQSSLETVRHDGCQPTDRRTCRFRTRHEGARCPFSGACENVYIAPSLFSESSRKAPFGPLPPSGCVRAASDAEASVPGHDDRVGPVADVELREDAGDVVAHRL